MKFEMSSQHKKFLVLAMKVASNQATPNEHTDLENLVKENPNYQHEFGQLKREFENEAEQEIMVSALRMALGTATPKETKMIESLEQSQPDQWEKVQDAFGFLEALASRAESAELVKPQPMPPKVRNELLASLKAVRERHSGR